MNFFVSTTPQFYRKKILMKNFDTLTYFSMVLEEVQGFFLILLCTVLTNASVHMVVGHPDFFRFLILQESVNLLIVRYTICWVTLTLFKALSISGFFFPDNCNCKTPKCWACRPTIPSYGQKWTMWIFFQHGQSLNFRKFYADQNSDKNGIC